MVGVNMKKYYKLNEEQIVNETLETNSEVDSSYIEYDGDLREIIGKRWNGSNFENLSKEVSEVPETTEVTNADLLEVLLAIGEKVGA